MAAAVRYLLDHPDDADRMAAGARAWLGERFSGAALGDALVAAYEPSRSIPVPRTDQETPCT
jgi:hypothetical protein